jgi:hypothetical protein
MGRCGRCGQESPYISGYCGSCQAKINNEVRAESERWRAKNEESREWAKNRGQQRTAYSAPLPLWAKIVAGLLVLGVAFFFAHRAGYVDRALSGIAGLLGNETASDNAGVEAIRKTDWSEFADESQMLSDSETAADQTAITAFMQSGESYRMSSSIKYGYYDSGYMQSRFEEFWLEMEMSYNSELDVYKFVFSDIILYDDEKLNQYFGSFKEGTYYIVNEDGKPYVLAEIDGERTVTDASENQSLYNTLMGLRMESVIGFDFFGEESFRAYRLNGGTAYKADDFGEYSNNYNPIEIVLKTYADKPVYHYYCREYKELGFEQQFEYNFYYNKIPGDNPTVADWK